MATISLSFLFLFLAESFAAVPAIPVAEPLPAAFALATADLDGDSRDDLLIGTASGVVRLLGAVDAAMQPGRTLLSGCRVTALAVLDANGDGITDVAALCPDSNVIILLKGTGKGEFGESSRLPVQTGGGSSGIALTASDLNGDGVADLAVSHYGGLLLLFGNGDATFSERRLHGMGEILSIAAGDYNGDGWRDLAVSRGSSAVVGVYYASGGGTFRAEQALRNSCDGYARVVRATDLDRDGYADLVAACDEGAGVWKGSGEGLAEYRLAISDRNRPLSVDVGDLNGDGLVDVALGNYYSGRVALHLAKADGTFEAPEVVRAAGDVFALSLADVDGDSRLDVVATSYSSDSALVALGRGDGKFEGSILLGSLPVASFFRKAPQGREGRTAVALVIPARKAVFEMRPGEGEPKLHCFRDYVLDAAWGDFDGDGAQDLVVAGIRFLTVAAGEDMAGTIWLMRGVAGGGLSKAQRITAVIYPASSATLSPLLSVGEFSGDGKLDFAYYNGATLALQVYAGKGDGTFELGAAVEGISVTALASADYDGDGIGDVASAERNTLSVHYGSRTARFRESRSYETCRPMAVTTIFAGDFAGDTRPDVLALCFDHLAVLAGEQGGLSVSRVTYSFASLRLGRAPLLDTGDFNADGKLDFVSAWPINTMWGGGMILLTQGVGSYGVLERLSLPPMPAALVVLHWDTDGRPDVATVSAMDGTVQILLDSERGSR